MPTIPIDGADDPVSAHGSPGGAGLALMSGSRALCAGEAGGRHAHRVVWVGQVGQSDAWEGEMELKTLADVLEAELKDLYSAEKQLVEALPDIVEAASSDKLKDAVSEHLEETRGHVRRLEQVFEEIGVKAEPEHCDGMEGLISEGSEIAEMKGDGDARDAALIGAAQRVEHYEIAAYGTARALAEQLGHTGAAKLLSETLDEEGAADEKLTSIAKTITAAATR
jgi:ferritin-like metal-binding protein YciE